ncbi:MAG: hypothetical protein JNN07_13415 [Verrucomicrobiales bacterium]|nr:hypothetical protein [Verrucomicrobiales bacterium]
MNILNKLVLPTLILTAMLHHPPATAQTATAGRPPEPPPTGGPTPTKRESVVSVDLVLFDLDFKGGTPGELVEAIQKQTKRPLNVIIPDDGVNDRIPALKMRNVTVRDLFLALGQATATATPVPGSNGSYSLHQTASWFKTLGNATDDSIWYYQSPKPVSVPKAPPPQACRFYQLAGYLDRLTVDDIITAVETGWKLMNDGSDNPHLTFHRETKLLIAVGGQEKLRMIDDVLQQLKNVPREKETSPAPAKQP